MDTLKVSEPSKKITFLGHAGFMIETHHELILMDPWLSDTGAYDSAWFQYPCNHHLADIVRRKVEETSKNVLVYVSHEHRDHLDETFLRSLPETKVTLIMPRFIRDHLYAEFGDWEGGSFFFDDGGRFGLHDGYLEFYIHDSVREADSAVLFHMDEHNFNFLNMNDCHIQDRVAQIKKDNGFINVLACHFSGASWFPTCYRYDQKTKDKKVKRVKLGRFSMLCKLIEEIQPLYYIPSAGPACFLDDGLSGLNSMEESVFPHASEFYEFWKKWRGDLSKTYFAYHRPGDKLFYTPVTEPPIVGRQELIDEIKAYQIRVGHHLDVRHKRIRPPDNEILDYLVYILQEKVDHFPLAEQVNCCLILRQAETIHAPLVKVDFQTRTVEEVPYCCYDEMYQYGRHYAIIADNADFSDLAVTLTWYEWLLSFRFGIIRTPDEFDVLLDGFLVNETEDLGSFCRHYKERISDEHILVHTISKTYKVCRKCPHEGADLSNAWIDGNELVCSKHGWRFDLENGGKCDMSDATINAVEVVDEKHTSS